METHRLKILHRAGAGRREICGARAALIDMLLRYMWNAVKASFSPESQKEFPQIGLVAIGGYGRAKLNPFSDIDFMFLHEGQVVAGSKPLPFLSKMMDGILYPLWDSGAQGRLFRPERGGCGPGGAGRHAIQDLAHRGAPGHRQ